MIKRLHFTLQKYLKIVEAGVFEQDNMRVELIRGVILEMNPIGPQHCELVNSLVSTLRSVRFASRKQS